MLNLRKKYHPILFLHSFIGGKAKTDENHSLISNKTKHEFIRNAIIMSTAFARFLCFKRIIQGILQQVRADNQSRNKKKKIERSLHVVLDVYNFL